MGELHEERRGWWKRFEVVWRSGPPSLWPATFEFKFECLNCMLGL